MMHFFVLIWLIKSQLITMSFKEFIDYQHFLIWVILLGSRSSIHEEKKHFLHFIFHEDKKYERYKNGAYCKAYLRLPLTCPLTESDRARWSTLCSSCSPIETWSFSSVLTLQENGSHYKPVCTCRAKLGKENSFLCQRKIHPLSKDRLSLLIFCTNAYLFKNK